jgi:hypothetical protein
VGGFENLRPFFVRTLCKARKKALAKAKSSAGMGYPFTSPWWKLALGQTKYRRGAQVCQGGPTIMSRDVTIKKNHRTPQAVVF